MKLYCAILLLIGGLLSSCNLEEKKHKEAPPELVIQETTVLCQRCNEFVIRDIQGRLSAATALELAALLCLYAPTCSWEKDQEAHAVLVEAFDKRLPELLTILASDADLYPDYILQLLSRPATQSLPQRNILLQLQEKKEKTAVAQQVQAAIKESVEKGDQLLRKLANDKQHTYQ